MTNQGGSAVLFVLACGLAALAGTVSGNETPLDEYLEVQIQRFKVGLHRILESERLRKKRDVGQLMTLASPAVEPAAGRLRISALPSQDEDLSLTDFRVVRWTWTQSNSFVTRERLVAILTDDRRLVLLNFDGTKFIVLRETTLLDNAYNVQIFESGPYVWLAVAFQSLGSGTDYIQMFRYNGSVIHLKQSIPLSGTAEVALGYNRGDWYMAVATPDKLALYEWRQTQFDLVSQELSIFGIKSLTLWSSSGVLHIATAVTHGAAGSPIFLYTRRNGGKLKQLQILPTLSAIKVIRFLVDGSSYLLLATDNAAVIYWWADDQYLEFQVLDDTAGALDASSLLLPNGEIALVLAFQNEVRFYQEGFSSEYYMSFSRFLNAVLYPRSNFFYQDNSYYFLFLTFDLRSWDVAVASGVQLPGNIWKLNLAPFSDPLENEDPLIGCINSLRDRLAANEPTLDYAEANIDRVWVSNKEQVIQAPVIIEGKVIVSQGLNVDQVILEGPDEHIEVPQVTNTALRDDLVSQATFVDILSGEMGDLVSKTSDQVITGDIHFLNPLGGSNFELPFLKNDFNLNGVPFKVLSENTLRTEGEQTLWQSLQMTHLQSHNIFLDGTINDIRTQDLVLLHTNEVVLSELHFHNVTVQDIVLPEEGTVNGLRPATFVTINQPQVIHGVKQFHNLVVKKNLVVHGQTNQRDLSVFVQRVLRLDNPDPTSFGNLQFSFPLTVEGDVYINGPINAVVDLHALATRAMDLDSDQVVIGKKTFAYAVLVNGDVTVEGTTNGIDISAELFTLSTDQFIPGTVIFDSMEIMGNLTTGTVNGFNLEREAVTRQGPPQTITGRKKFINPVQVVQDVFMNDGSTLNSLDLSSLVDAASRAENVVLIGKAVFHSLSIQELIKSDAINGVSLDDLYYGLWRKSTDQEIQSTMEFVQPIIIEHDLETRSVNGYDLTEDFVHVMGDEDISGYMRFLSTTYIHGSLDMAPGVTLNGFDISEYNRSLVQSPENPILDTHVVFPSLEVLGNVYISGNLRGNSLDNLLQVNKEQVLTGHVTLLSDKTKVDGSLVVDNLYLEKDINGVDFSELDKHVVYDFDSSQDSLAVLQNKEFLGHIIVDGIVSYGRVDGVNIGEWHRRAVTLSSDGILTGPKNISQAEFLQGFSATNLNGVPLDEYLKRVVQGPADVISGPKTITGSVVVNGDLTMGLLNGVNLPDLALRAAYKDVSNTFEGYVIIDDNLEIAGDLSLGEHSLLDGLPWSQLVFLHENEVLPGFNSFPNGVFTREATVSGLVNGCDLNKLAEEAIYLSQPLPPSSGPITVNSLLVHGNVDVLGPVSNFDLSQLAQNVLRKSGNQTLTGAISLSHLSAAHLHVKNINHLDVTALMQDAVLRSQAQTIFGSKTFTHPQGVSIHNGLNVIGDIAVNGGVNGIDVSNLQAVAVTKDSKQDIHGHKIFTEIEVQGDIIIEGTLNGVAVPSELILLNTEEHIPTELVLQSGSQVLGQLLVGARVDGVHLQQLIENRVTLLHHQEIEADLTFEDTLFTDSLEVLGSVNQIPITDIVLRHETLHISGQKTFENVVTVASDVQVQLLNGVDLQDFNRNLVRINQPQFITEEIEFVTEVEIQNDLVILESINDVQLDGLVQQFNVYSASLSQDLSSLQNQLTVIDGHIQSSQAQIQKRQFWEILYFADFQYVEMSLNKIFKITSETSPKDQTSRELLAWISSSCNPITSCCGQHNSQILNVDPQGYLSPVGQQQHGRFFPFYKSSDANLASQAQGFVLWTNTTSLNQKCVSGHLEGTAISALQGLNLDLAVAKLLPLASPYVQHVKSFEELGQLYLIISYSYNKFNASSAESIVYRYDDTLSVWQLHQTIGSPLGTTSVDLIQSDARNPQLLVALANLWEIRIYRWNSQSRFELAINIPHPAVQDLLWVAADSQLHLLVAKKEELLLNGASTIQSEYLNVYTYLSAEPQLVWLQTLALKGVEVLHAFYFSGETYVATSSEWEQEVTILQWRGYQHFTPIQRISVPGVTSVSSYMSVNRDLLLVATSGCKTLVFKAVLVGMGLK